MAVSIEDAALPPVSARNGRPAVWRETVAARVNLLRSYLRVLAPDAPAVTVAAVEQHLMSVERAIVPHGFFSPLAGLRDWWSGAAVDSAWMHLHNAEVLMVELMPEADLLAGRSAVVALVENTLTTTDPRRVDMHAQLSQSWTVVGTRERAVYRTALQWGFVATDEQYTRVRSFRNLIIICTIGLFLLAGGLAYLGSQQPALISLCFSNAVPADAAVQATVQANEVSALEPRDIPAVLTQSCPTGQNGPTGGDLPLVTLLGMVGGALSAAVGIRGMRGTATPYGVPVALALLKLPAGALLAPLALMLLAGDFIPGLSGLDSPRQILAYSVVLGYAQQLVTRLIDKQADRVLDRVPSSEPPSTAEARANPPTARPPSSGMPQETAEIENVNVKQVTVESPS
ncbi:hypothetical protein ACIA8K_07235 [Catenuloplanes sp. NPDC051500]|uniref:hypothetical protein n=1 Tax=Catenuloplanes sp. NPDC051500 TaxID=3363959 RepID=UPI00378FC56A